MSIRLLYDPTSFQSSHSGYGQLGKYVEGTAWNHSARSVRRRLLLPGKKLYHFLDAQDDRLRTTIFRPRFGKVVATFPQTPAELEAQREDKGYIRDLDAAFVFSQEQANHLTRYLPWERIFLVPMGVDTPFWCPDPAVEKPAAFTVLFVSSPRVDPWSFAKVVQRAKALGCGLRFRAVTSPAHRQALAGLPDTEVVEAAGEAALLAELRRAHVLFAPLTDCPVEETVLQALACGTPVVAARNGGIGEYVDDRCAVLVPPGQAEQAVQVLHDLAKDRARLARLAAAARPRAMQFSWDRVGAQMNYIYRRLVGKSCKALFRQHEKAPRTICLLTEEYPPETGWGGIATYGYNLAIGLSQAGHKVIVISGTVDRAFISSHDGVEVHRVKFEPKGKKKEFWAKRVLPRLKDLPEFRRRIEFALAARKRFRYLYDRMPIHLIESPEYFGSLYAIQWMRRRCPTMIKLHTPSEVNCWVNDVPVSKDIKRSNILEKGSTKRADKITAPSRKIIDIVTKRWLPGQKGIELLEYPIDTDVYSPGPGRVTPRKHFLFTGRLEHRKGVHLLVEAFVRVARDIPDFDLHFAGHDTPTFARDGKQGMRFMEWLEGANIPPDIRKRMEFLGRIPLRELIPLYRGAFACIVPSTSFENFPNSCLEAISCGKAVIVSDAGGMVEMVAHMESGIHVKANDVDSLAEAIRHMAKNEEETARFGKRAREIVLERYATKRIVERTMAVFDSVIAKGRYR
ncbi:MAG: glycosyltransferase [Planctomycetes bacterium]|nr:glycosyltransferase [Planctomycetota bacterium]MCC7396667.1 glycosyltransferase [Planctomycetota bacterium]